MKTGKKRTYADRIRLRIRLLWGLVIAMLIYMVVVAELGGGDSRMMTPLAEKASRIIFFGGLIYAGYRIWYNKKLLKDRLKLKEKQVQEQDERNRALHDKSGGLVMDILLVLLLGITCTAALFDMSAFYTAYIILIVAAALKGIAWYCAHRGMI
ncbi:MAG: hypothetical protein E7329_11785 [Clostridiales bacterium]|nr:hypothetical protein [Clostridiales bacterium]